jgi:hypothetical protein
MEISPRVTEIESGRIRELDPRCQALTPLSDPHVYSFHIAAVRIMHKICHKGCI